jgi:hypothetical protein
MVKNAIGTLAALLLAQSSALKADNQATFPYLVDTAGLRDVAARVDFDLGRGVFCLSMPSATTVIRDAYASVEGWKSTDAGYKRRVISKTADRMLIECARDDAPTLLLEFALQPGFIGLRTGLKNTTSTLIRIRKFEPLSGGTVFPGGKWSDTRTLTANTAGNDPMLVKTVFAKSANNLLLTLKQDGVRRSLVIGALRTEDYTKWLHILPLAGKDGDESVGALIAAIDPVGKEVDPGLCSRQQASHRQLVPRPVKGNAV